MLKLKDYLYRQMFNHSLIGLLLNPFFIARANLFTGIRKAASLLPKTGKLLDVGCGAKPYEIFFEGYDYLGLEIESSQNRAKAQADVFYDGHTFPFEAGRFSVVMANQVLEHVFNPDEFLENIHRILSPDGRLLLTLPFVWDEHEQPFDYARYSSFGLKHLLEKHGFEISHHQKSVQGVGVIFQLINAYFYKVLRSYGKIIYFICLPFFSISNALGWVLNAILPSNPDLFLDHIVIAKKK